MGAVFHGGEPLLFPKRRFDALQKKLRDIEQRTGCVIKRGVTTNGILVDEEWVELFKTHDVDVTVSLDGPADQRQIPGGLQRSRHAGADAA